MEVPHNPAPTVGTDHALTDGERADFLVKLMSHVRLHLLYLAEKLQEQLRAPEGEMASAASNGQTQAPVTKSVITHAQLTAFEWCCHCMKHSWAHL